MWEWGTHSASGPKAYMIELHDDLKIFFFFLRAKSNKTIEIKDFQVWELEHV